MEDGTFLYNGSVDIMLDNEDKSAKGCSIQSSPPLLRSVTEQSL